MSKKRIITFGTFDLFHVGHLNILERSKKLGDTLIVGISTDNLNYSKKQKYPLYKQEERLRIVNALGIVDEVFYEESLELKRDYILKYNADILVMGNDWEGKFDEFKDVCEVVYLERTPSISTTEIVEIIRSKD
ncbi:MAG: adenylyltransferase/cytidyltransferase family protein [Marinifilaceae bacterium]|jgi:glycerol-3-phosphate cytidylyltransferase|nr:adenylyltransferase/cytidyltransferase family protein [Marinifilaceae bacterium]